MIMGNTFIWNFKRCFFGTNDLQLVSYNYNNNFQFKIFTSVFFNENERYYLIKYLEFVTTDQYYVVQNYNNDQLFQMKKVKVTSKFQSQKNYINSDYQFYSDPLKLKDFKIKSKKFKQDQASCERQDIKTKNQIDHFQKKKKDVISKEIQNRLKIEPAKIKKKIKEEQKIKNIETFRTKKHQNSIEQKQDLFISTKLEQKSKGSISQTNRFGRSLEFNRFLNKINSKNQKIWKSQTVSPTKKKYQKESKKKNDNKKIQTSRPSSGRTMIQNNINQVLMHKQFKNHQILVKIKQFLKLIQKQQINQKLNKAKKDYNNQRKSNRKKQYCFLKNKNPDKKYKTGYASANPSVQNFSTKQMKSATISRKSTFNKNSMIVNQKINLIKQGSQLFTKQSSEQNNKLKEEYKDIQQINLTQFDEGNIEQLRNIQTSSQNRYIRLKKALNVQQSQQLLLMNQMARRIQRCWRRYRTIKLVKMYSQRLNKMKHHVQTFLRAQKQAKQNKISHNNSSQIQYYYGNQFLIQEQESKPSQVKQAINIAQYKSKIKTIKLEEAKKWNEIIEIISNSNRNQTDKILQKIIQQSQINKLKLQKLQSINTQQKDHQQNFQEQNKSNSKSQSFSNELLNCDLKKYQEILNPNLFDIINERETILIEKQRKQKQKISIKKQSKLISENIYQNKYNQIEEWVKKQKKSINLHKKELEQGVQKVKQTFKKMQLQYIMFVKSNGKTSYNKFLKRSFSQQSFKIGKIGKQIKVKQLILNKAQQEKINNLISHENQNNQNKKSEESSIDQIESRIIKQYVRKSQQNQQIDLDQVYQRQNLMDSPVKQFEYQTEKAPKSKRVLQLAQLFEDIDSLVETVTESILTNLSFQYLKQIAFKSRLIENFKKIVRNSRKIDNKKQKGIKIVIQFIKIYLNGLITYIIDKHPDVLKNLEIPNGPKAAEFLKYLHSDTSLTEKSQEGAEEEFVISKKISEQYWKMIQNTIVFETELNVNDQKSKLRIKKLKYLTQLYMEAVFDAFNEVLNEERIYGAFGKPYPWKNTFSKIIQKKNNSVNYKNCLANAYNRTIENASVFCGIIIQNLTQTLSQDEIRYLREDRFKKLQEIQMKEKQQSFIFYDDEETYTIISIANLVGEYLIKQFCKTLQLIKLRRSILINFDDEY